MTPDQSRALALARARKRRAEAEANNDPRNSLLGKVDTFVRGAADTLTFGLADEFAAGMGALTGIGGERGNYEGNLETQREIDKSDAEDRFGYRLGGQLAGGVGGGVGLARSGLSMTANTARAGGSLGQVAGASAVEGSIIGGLHGTGSGEGAEGRLQSGVVGSVAGLGTGFAAPYAVAGGTAVAKSLASPVMARLRPDAHANQALGEALRRSGMTPDEVALALQQANADGQSMYTVADAMGHSGQRMLSTVVRTPNNARQGVVDALVERQVGQSDRLSNTLARGFDAPDTAMQRTDALTAARDTLADANYDAARQGAGQVNVSGVLQEINETLRPGPGVVISRESRIADDTVEGVARRVERMLTDGDSVATDFSSLLRVKNDIDDMIRSAEARQKGNQARVLTRIKRRLDAALEAASPEYRAANDVYRQQSQAIDAIGAGTAAKSGRRRSADTIRQFNAMSPEAQSGFRAGYADPYIAQVEASSLSPMTNRARPLITAKTREEFPAFAATPEQGNRMLREVGREQRMFETANTALGGSKTADNLADAAEMSKFDPAVMTNLLRGRPVAAAISAVTRLANEASGMPPSVIERIAGALMTSNPQAALAILQRGTASANQSTAQRAIATAILNNLNAAGVARIQ